MGQIYHEGKFQGSVGRRHQERDLGLRGAGRSAGSGPWNGRRDCAQVDQGRNGIVVRSALCLALCWAPGRRWHCCRSTFDALDKAQEELSRDLTLPLLIHGGIWAACGLAGGVALAIGLGAGRTRTDQSRTRRTDRRRLGRGPLRADRGDSLSRRIKTTSPLADDLDRPASRAVVGRHSCGLARGRGHQHGSTAARSAGANAVTSMAMR